VIGASLLALPGTREDGRERSFDPAIHDEKPQALSYVFACGLSSAISK